MNKRDEFIKKIMELGVENEHLMTSSNEQKKLNFEKARKIYVKYYPKVNIDRVTTQRLEMTLRMCGIFIDISIIDNIVDIVELIEEKGDKVNLKDITKLTASW